MEKLNSNKILKREKKTWQKNNKNINTYKLFGLVIINSVMGSVSILFRKGGPEIFTVQHSNEKYMQLRQSPFFYRITSQTEPPTSPASSSRNSFLFSSKRISFSFLSRANQTTNQQPSVYLCSPAFQWLGTIGVAAAAVVAATFLCVRCSGNE